MSSNFINENSPYFTTLFIENDKSPSETKNVLRQFFPNMIHIINKQNNMQKYINHHNKTKENMVDLIIADIDISKKSEFEMLREIRKYNKNILIIIISSDFEKEDLLKAIKIGVCNYLVKPLNTEQVHDVYNELLEYNYTNKMSIKLQNNYTWNKSECSLSYDNTQVKLTKNEIKLIDYLISSNNNVKSSQAIEDFVFEDIESNNKRIRNLISRLNKKLSTNLIKSIYAQGYKITT